MDRLCGRSVLRPHERGSNECRFLRVDAGKLRRIAAANNRGLRRQSPHSLERSLLLRARDQGAHARLGIPRIAHLDRVELVRKRIRHRIGSLRCRHEDAADGGAFLPCLDRHLAHHFAQERIIGSAPAAGPAPAVPH